MKRITAMLISIVFVFSLLCSCGQPQPTPDTSESDSLRAEIARLQEQLASQAKLITQLLEQKEDALQNNNGNENQNENQNENEEEEKTDAPMRFEYVKENGGITITKYTGNDTNVRIPENIEGLPVLKIGKNAFADAKIRNVTLPSVCECIDWFAFYGCFNLSGVYLSSATTSIGYGAFDGCSKNLTFYCTSNSYAQKYAQSFGFAYSTLN